MKIDLLTPNLQQKLSFLNRAISTKNQLPVLLNILIETQGNAIKLSSTDLEIGIEVICPAKIEESGKTTVPARLFTELIASLTDDSLTMKTVDSKLEVVTKRTKSVFQTVSGDEFPRLYEVKGEKLAILSGKGIKKEFSSVVFSASQDTTRPALSGVLVRKEAQGFLLVATDGYRLSLRHYKVTESKTENASFIIPARVFRELLAMKEDDADITVYVSKENNQVIFEQGETTLIGRLIDAEFPNFEKIIPSDFSVSVSFDREELLKAVKICSVFARDSANIIKLSLTKNHIVVSSGSSAVGENTVQVESMLSGEENEIAFNARYLLDVLGNVEEKEMSFDMIGPLNPGIFKIKDDESFLHLIMPIRVQS
ncbi:MAG TPA: DNA polymerase III subunit beta [Candidatus Sulfotelmatobacter sp.]|jgi:DNA polymerase-3 subunit beta|nr:DNA polymerase III subunit beta [Candidatus Sulfotelmatobacter sp.]